MSPNGDERHDGGTGTANPPPAISVQTSPTSPQPPQSQRTQQRPTTISIPKTRSNISQSSSTTSLRQVEQLARLSVDSGGVPDGYNDLTRSPIVPAERTGLYRIRQQPMRQPSSPNLQPSSPTALTPISSRKSSMNALGGGPISPAFPPSEDLSRFPTESLHSFSFAHQSSDTLENRNAVIKRSVEFLTNKLQWAATSPRIASAQARLAGDEEVLSMIELLQKANVQGGQPLSSIDIGSGPLTGPAHHTNENIFAASWGQSESPTALENSASLTSATSGVDSTDGAFESTSPSSLSTVTEGESSEMKLARIPTIGIEGMPTTPQPQRTPLKRTYTDTAGYSLHNRLTEAMARPYRAEKSSTPMVPQIPPRSNTNVTERAPHGHNRNAPNQAIFTTESTSPWTITAANDLACLVFGVTRAEVRKLGIMEVIREDRRKWLEEKLRNPESGTAPKQAKPPPPPAGKIGVSKGLASMRNGVTAKLLSKPPARQTAQSRRSKTVDGTQTPPKETPKESHHPKSKSRGVLLCGDVVPIRKMNGSNGSASLWVKEKGNNLIWVLEEIAEDIAIITVDEIGLVLRGSGDIEAIFGLDRVRNGMDVQRLIPAWPKIKGTSTGAVDYEALARLRRFTARTSNSISIPVTIDQQPEESVFRVSSFPHIAGIIVVNPATMRVSSSNSVFAAALFGHANPDGLAVAELIPSFDKILRVMTDEDKIALVDGIVIPEHSFRRARALLALREGAADAAAIFLRPSGVPAKHRDGAEIMIDVQMRVVKSDRDPIYNETVIEEDQPLTSEVVYALWITYSRQLHAVNHGVGPVTPLISRPSTPPHQPAPGPSVDSPAPSPMVMNETASASPLDQELEKTRTTSLGRMSPTALAEGEPFEHPSPDLIAANVKVIQKKKIDDFTILEEMGQGAYGQVKLARYKKAAASKMCIKYVTKRRILVDTWHRDRRLGTVPLEIHVLDYLRRDGLQHPNIVEMADFFEDDINYYIEMIPHGLPGMDLFDYIELRVTMEEQECRKIFRQVGEALRHLHMTAMVVHRDIKDENVILDGEGRVKLVDFGSAAYIKNGPFDVFVGTIDYAAPEVLRGSPYRGKEQDVWALGILLYTIVYKENPFYSIDEIMDHDLRVPYVLSEDCIDLIRKMLDRDVERRIGIQAVMEHPWVTFVDEEDEDEGSGTGLELPTRKVAVAA